MQKHQPQSLYSLFIMLSILTLFNVGIKNIPMLHAIDLTFFMALICWFGTNYLRSYIPTDIFPGVKIIGLVLFLSAIFVYFFPNFSQEAIAVSFFVLIGHNLHQSGKA